MESKGVFISRGIMDYQIFQQDSTGFATIKIGGEYKTMGNASEYVAVKVVLQDNGEVVLPYTAADYTQDGKWEATFKLPAGGLYTVKTSLQSAGVERDFAMRGDMAFNVGVGDLYVIAGQSNASGFGQDPVYDPPELGVHIFRNSNTWALAVHPLQDSTNSAHPVNSDGANPNHSPWLAFARYLKLRLNYPIGLIQTSQGGSPISKWNPAESGILHRNMMEVLKESSDGKVKGILWYQGCSEAMSAGSEKYLERFTNMVKCVRSELGYNVPYLTVQINRFMRCGEDRDADPHWANVREDQRQAAKCIDNVYVTPNNDAKLADLAHTGSSANMQLGERMARQALAALYGMDNYYKAPDISRITAEGDEVRMVFDNVSEDLYMLDSPASYLPFVIRDTQGDLEIKDYKIQNGNEILLSLNRAVNGEYTVYGAQKARGTQCIPFDRATHLPILSFTAKGE